MREKLTIPSQREPSVALMLDASGVLQTQNLTWGEKWNKNVGWLPGVGSWRVFLEPQAECAGAVTRRHHGGGGGGDGEDGAAFHLLGAVFLNPRSAC